MRAKMGAKEKNVNGLQGQWPGTAPCGLVPTKGYLPYPHTDSMELAKRQPPLLLLKKLRCE